MSYFRFYSRGLKFLLKLLIAKWTNTNFVQAFRKVMRRHPHKVMFIDADSGDKWTFKQVLEIEMHFRSCFDK